MMNRRGLLTLLKKHGVSTGKITSIVDDVVAKTSVKLPRRIYDKMREHVSEYGVGAVAMSRAGKFYNVKPERISIAHGLKGRKGERKHKAQNPDGKGEIGAA